jgi:acetoin utilization deacetylase AcuC-like enzyme
MKRVGLVADLCFLEHITSDSHPEHPDRLRAMYDMLDEEEMRDRFAVLAPRMATLEELQRIHTEAYVRRIESTRGCSHLMLDPDTHLSSETHRVSRLAAGGLLVLLDALGAGTIRNGFALVRPPGHHAEAGRGMGFCIYNNVAVAARYAQHRGLARSVLIVDWDLHHGNGTQHAFESDPTVLYVSSHMYPYYPGTGRMDETGTGPGKGFTVNIPLPGGHGDQDFCWLYEKILVPLAEQFEPDLILVSAGFDIYARDPLGTMRVTEEGFAGMAKLLLGIAQERCNGRILFTLEGGYDVEGQARSVKAVLNVLDGKVPDSPLQLSSPSSQAEEVFQRIRDVHKDHWEF